MHIIKNLLMEAYIELMQVSVAYRYMVQNAPTEEARRLVEMNLMTAQSTLEKVDILYSEIVGEKIPNTGQYAENIPIFADFMQAARYAFMKETHLIAKVKELYLSVDSCYKDALFGVLVEHQLNAMRLLYLMS